MSKLDLLLEKYTSDLEEIGESVDPAFLFAMAKSCGPGIYRKDASLVAVSDPDEIKRVRQNFLIRKLGLPDTEALDEGISTVKQRYSKRAKQRVVFYYLLATHFDKRADILQ